MCGLEAQLQNWSILKCVSKNYTSQKSNVIFISLYPSVYQQLILALPPRSIAGMHNVNVLHVNIRQQSVFCSQHYITSATVRIEFP